MEEFNLDREFIRWFYEHEYPNPGQNRCGVMRQTRDGTVDWHDYWMRESYKAGARAMYEDINLILADWACAVEGCKPEMVEPCEVFDRARENLHCYINEQLELFK